VQEKLHKRLSEPDAGNIFNNSMKRPDKNNVKGRGIFNEEMAFFDHDFVIIYRRL